jgi:protein phosphatase
MSARPSDAAFATDIGPLRPRNEDVALSDLDQGVHVVADGLGGAAAGDRAARIAAETIRTVLTADDGPLSILGRLLPAGNSRDQLERSAPVRTDLDDAETRLRFALLLAHHAVLAEGRSSGAVGMAAAVVCAWHAGDAWWLAHVGDCRAYVLERGELSLLTRDHSLSAALAGRLTVPQPTESGPFLRSRLTQVVGGENVPTPDLRCWLPPPGARLLLCTDGVWGPLGDAQMRAALTVEGGALDIAQGMVRRGLQAGSRDNATALVVLF